MSQVSKASIIQPETILDFIDGVTQRRDTPEERVRQEILKSLVREYGYKKEQIGVEESIKFGSNRKAVDVAIWEPGKAHTQENIYIIVECKDPKTKAKGKKDGVDQMHSYASACMNSTYGMWTNGDELLTFRYVVDDAGKRGPEAVPDLPHAGGEVPDDAPRFDQLAPPPATHCCTRSAAATTTSPETKASKRPRHFLNCSKSYSAKFRTSATPRRRRSTSRRPNARAPRVRRSAASASRHFLEASSSRTRQSSRPMSTSR